MKSSTADRFRMASWRYSRALALFLCHGAGRRANRALKEALEWNPFVAPYLIGVGPEPEPPAAVRFQDPTEAASYLFEGGAEAWLTHEPAMEWLLDQFEGNLTSLLGR